MVEGFEATFTGGHPNSLGRMIEMVDTVLADPGRFDGFFACYSNADEGIRLRVTKAMICWYRTSIGWRMTRENRWPIAPERG